MDRANAFVEDTAPWKLAKEGSQDALRSALGALARALARITVLASPFMPGKTGTVWAALGASPGIDGVKWRAIEDPPVRGKTVQRLSPLFPKEAPEPVTD